MSHAELRGLDGSPIHRVSEDVLLCIFHDVVHPPPSGQHLARLGLVCKHWREIVESASTLWAYITALDGLPHVRNALRHTGQAPLDIVYPRGARCKADAFLLLVKDKIQYWRTVDISVSDADVLSDLQTSKMPLLENLRILMPYYHHRNASVIDIFGEPSVPSRLTELEIKYLSMTIPLWLANLTSLSLAAVGHVVMEDLLRVLQSSNNLKVLKLEQLFTLKPNKAIPHTTHLPSLLSLELWLPVEAIHYLLSGLRTNALSCLRLTCDEDDASPRDTLLSNQITHFMPTIRELVSRVTLAKFSFDPTGEYSLDLGDLNFDFDVQQIQSQYGFARDVFEWLAEHLGPNFRAMPVCLQFYGVEPHIEHLELYGAFPKPRVVEITLYAFDVPQVPPISVLQYLSSPRQSDPSQWPFPHLERINYHLRGRWNSYLVEMLKGRYGDPEHIQQAKLQPPQPLKEIRIYAGRTSDTTGPDMKFLKEVQDLAVGTKIFWKDEILTFE